MMHKLKYYIIIALLICFYSAGNAADTIKINLTLKHKLNAAGQTSGYKVIQQQFITPADVFFREVNYDETTGQISNYVFRFFKDNKLFTEECYNSHDSLLHILKHSYNAGGQEVLKEKLVPGPGHSLLTLEKTVITYDKNNRIISEKKYYSGQAGASCRYTYNAGGQLMSRKDTYKPAAKAAVKQESKLYSYNSDGTLKQVLITGKDNTGKRYSTHEEYAYQDNLLSSVKTIGADGNTLGEKIYKYQPAGALSIYEEHNATGQLVLLIEYDYRKHYMETGTQKSFYEGF